jgi:hypothetical protein
MFTQPVSGLAQRLTHVGAGVRVDRRQLLAILAQ